MAVAAQARAFAARHQQHLGVGLEAHHAIDHLRTDRLQRLGPVDVGFLVEARLQLDHHRHFLAAANGLAQELHHLGVGAGAVDGLLDGEHLRVIDRLAQKRQHGIKTLEGLVDQDVAPAHLRHHAAGTRQRVRPGRAPGGKQQVGLARQVDQLHQPHQVHGPRHAHHGGVGQAELRLQQVRQEGRAPGRHLEAHRLAVVALLQALAQGGAQVAHVFFIDSQVGMARDAKLRELQHLAARKQLAQMGADDARQADEALPLGRTLARQSHQARQRARHLDDGDLVVASEGVAAAQAHDEIERLVGHLRKRMGRIQPHRNQQRAHLALEMLAHPVALGLAAFAMAHDADAACGQRRHQGVVVERVLARHHFPHGAGQRGKRVTAGRRGRGRGHQMRRGPHLEQLVQVGRDDAQVAQALEQGHVRALGPVEHAFVEGQDAVVAIKQFEVGRHGHRDGLRRSFRKKVGRGGNGGAEWREQLMHGAWSRREGPRKCPAG